MKNKWVLLSILIVAAFLRLYKLGSYPVNLTPDEAALGYNAYSILETGRDEYGEFLPIVFKSFGDFKPGLYVYLTVPFVWLLGLNEWSVRLPSAIAGVVAVWIIAKLKIKNEKIKIRGTEIPINYIASLVLAISPWHIHFSRGAWEANAALTMTLGGVYLAVKSLHLTIDKKASSTPPLLRGRIMLWLSATLFGLSLWMYQGAKLSALLVVSVLAIVYAKEAWTNYFKKDLGVWMGILGLLVMPIGWGMLTGETGGRLAVKSIWSYETPIEVIQNKVLVPGGIDLNSWQYSIWHGEWLNTAREILTRYFNHFSGRFLVIDGDWIHPWLSSPYMGVMYWLDVVVFTIGAIWVIREMGQIGEGKRSKLYKVMLLWLFLAPVPSALTLDEVNAVRSLHMVVPLAFFVGMGCWVVIKKILNIKYQILNIIYLKYFGLFLLLGIVAYQMVYYLDSYYVLAPKLTASEGQGYGYKQIIEAVQSYRNRGNKIVVYQSYDQPYIYWLFYESYNPRKYQQIAHLDENRYGDVGLVGKIDDQVDFREFSLNAEKHLAGNIYAGPPEKIPESVTADTSNFKILDEIYYLNGHLAFRVVQVI